MKLKYYMCGLGSGIILAVIIMAIANKITPGLNVADNANVQETTGSVIAYTTQADNKDNSRETASASTETDKDNKQQTNDSGSTASQTGTTVLSTTKTQESVTTEAATKAGEQVVIHIDAVTVASDIARMLEDNGIIDNADGFIQYIYDKGYSRVLQEGDFTLSKGDSYENVAKIITRQ